jgi:hypothetical protein
MLAGCAAVPTAQLAAFSQSLAAVRQADQPIFADLALAEERSASNRADPCPDQPSLAVPGGAPIRNGFCLLEVASVAGIAEPPDTAAFKAGMEALQIYTGTLTTLAAADSAADTSAQLQTAAGNLAGIAQALKIGGAGFAAAITGPIGALAPLIDQAAAQFSRDEARRLILSGSEQVHAIIAAERAAVPAIWNIITSDWRDELTLISPKDFQGAARLRARIETYRAILSNYAIMLGLLDTAWTETVAATTNPQPATLSDLVALTGQLRTSSETLARAYASLRAGPASIREAPK